MIMSEKIIGLIVFTLLIIQLIAFFLPFFAFLFAYKVNKNAIRRCKKSSQKQVDLAREDIRKYEKCGESETEIRKNK